LAREPQACGEELHGCEAVAMILQNGGLLALTILLPKVKPAIVSDRCAGGFVCRTSQPQTPTSPHRNS
jgi:hypothetical protein